MQGLFVLSYVILAILALSLFFYYSAFRRSLAVVNGQAHRLHSRPSYYGFYVAAWAAIPSLLLILVWLLFQGPVIDQFLLKSIPAEKLNGLTPGQIDLLLSEIKQVARGNIFGQPDADVRAAAETYNRFLFIGRWAIVALAVSVALIAAVSARGRITERFRARQGVETILTVFMVVCSSIAILTTIGIILSLLFEAARFFNRVPLSEFLFGLNWEPQIALRADQALGAGGAFGAIPVFIGTLQIAFIAMLVAIPIGLFTAIYLSEYANPRFRAIIKPVIEILAGIPTVVYGFFAVLIVAPAMRDAGAHLGLTIAPNSALAAGAVMGIMIIPFISSLSDDAITAVPRSLREGSYALGATKGETITKVLLPAALPGIVGGVLLGVSRAIGETMIVVMAAGIIANLTLNPLEPVTTVTVQIVTLLIGDVEFDNPKTLAAFALGLMLFLVTLVLNIIALRIVQKYREKYD